MNTKLTGGAFRATPFRDASPWRPAPLLPDRNGHGAPADPALARVLERQSAITAEIRRMNDTVEAEGRNELTEDEETRLAELRQERATLDVRQEQLEEEETRRRAAAQADERLGNDTDGAGRGAATIGAEPQTYGRGSRFSYFIDLGRAELQNDPAARQRLERHGEEMRVEVREREKTRESRAVRGLKAIDERAFFETRVNPNRTDGQGGYFVPPLWLVDQYIGALRNGRPYANLVTNLELPQGTDSINIPKVTQGAAVGMQADGGAVTTQDMTDSFVNAGVKTVAGNSDFAMQLLDQSPVGWDEICIQDLLDDYAQKLDSFCFQGTGVGNTFKGLDFVAGTNTVTYTDGTPTGPELWPFLMQGLSQLGRNRKRLDGVAIFMQGTRWFWLASQLDAQNRPLVTPYPSGAFNPLAIGTDMENIQGPVANIGGFDTFLDLNITQVDGVGANQDRIYVVRPKDQYLWEGTMRTRIMTEVLSGTLQVRAQVYNYAAFMPDRYPSAISIIQGTGLVTPAGF